MDLSEMTKPVTKEEFEKAKVELAKQLASAPDIMGILQRAEAGFIPHLALAELIGAKVSATEAVASVFEVLRTAIKLHQGRLTKNN